MKPTRRQLVRITYKFKRGNAASTKNAEFVFPWNDFGGRNAGAVGVRRKEIAKQMADEQDEKELRAVENLECTLPQKP